MSTDLTLLRRYHEHTDAFAFRAVVEAHAGMVFATARRVTRDAALAEDVAQETFLELARNASAITDSVGAWLHRVARRRACNAVREAGTRRRYEEAATVVALEPDRTEPTWAELEPLIDEVLDALPDKVRAPLVEHFLEGRTQQEVAARLGVSQSTVSRLLDAGIAELRAGLKRKDVLAGASLAMLLTANAVVTPPAALMASLGKLAVAGVAAKPAVVAMTAWAWRAVAVATLTAAVGATWYFWGSRTPVSERAPGALPDNTTKAEVPPTTTWPAEPAGARDWIGRAFCPMCALEHTAGRPAPHGIFLHEEAGRTVLYDLKAEQPVKDFHLRFCVPSMTDKTAVHVRGNLELLNGRQTLALGTLEPATQ